MSDDTTDLRYVENVTDLPVFVDGFGELAPHTAADVPKGPRVTELVDLGALADRRRPLPKPKSTSTKES